jgi:hypothetical protein
MELSLLHVVDKEVDTFAVGLEGAPMDFLHFYLHPQKLNNNSTNSRKALVSAITISSSTGQHRQPTL